MTPPSRSLGPPQGPPATSAPTDPQHAPRTRPDLTAAPAPATAIPAPPARRTPRRKPLSGLTPGSGKG